MHFWIICKILIRSSRLTESVFDIPYLTNKCQKYKIPEPFSAYEYVDIYKMISGFRFLFALPNLKQKTVEQFIGLEREDAYNGGELIDVYKACQKNPDKNLSLF